MGFESVFQEVRNKLNKGIPDLQIKEVYRLRESVRKKLKDKILFVAYVLFGLESIDEASVKESVKVFREHLDGVIAIKYRRYKETMPKETAVSEDLLNFLRSTCLDVDLTTSEIWELQLNK